LLGLEQDPSDWLLLTALEGDIANENARLLAFSDGNSSSVKVLNAKGQLVGRAVAWLVELGLSPNGRDTAAR
jgi:hypothetical protein